jgi:DNA polymerase V
MRLIDNLKNNAKIKSDRLVVSEIYTVDDLSELKLPMFMESVSAGFPSPADDYLEGKLDLNKHLIKNPSSTFFLRVQGDSMIDAGIYSGDILVVDRSLAPKNGSIVIAVIDSELLVKRLDIDDKKIYLIPENKKYNKIEITTEMQFEVWGVVSTVIHSVL